MPKAVLTLYGVFSWVSGDITSASNAATYVETKGGGGFGQLTLRRPLSAPGRALGRLELRPALADQPLGPHDCWPAMAALFSTQAATSAFLLSYGRNRMLDRLLNVPSSPGQGVGLGLGLGLGLG